MNRIEELFIPFIDAFDVFLNVDEKEVGCLNEREHEKLIVDRNYYSQLFVEKLNGTIEQLAKENLQKSYPMLFETFTDDSEGMGKRKRKQLKEVGMG